jgi:hypothetical protein
MFAATHILGYSFGVETHILYVLYRYESAAYQQAYRLKYLCASVRFLLEQYLETTGAGIE